MTLKTSNSLEEEEEVIEEYDSDFDSNLSSPQLSEDEEMESAFNLENAKCSG